MMDAVAGKGTIVIPIDDWRKQRYLTWLCTPVKEREPRSVVALAEELGLHRNTLANWRDEADFLQAWEKKYLQTIGSPEIKSEIMATLRKTATDPDDPKHVQAAKTYFEIEGSMKPQQVSVNVSGSARDLTDAQLKELLAGRAAAEVEQRGLRVVE